MAEQPRTATAAKSWRCTKCGTSNPSADDVTDCLGCGMPRPVGTVPASPPPGSRVVIRTARGRWLLAASWAYSATVLSVLGLIHGVGDSWWVVTLLLFMPRWLFLGPVAILAAASGLWRCPTHWVIQVATGAVVAGPLMGASLPVHRLWGRPPAGDRLRIATFNLGLVPVREGDLKRWLEARGLDVVCFQEGGAGGKRLLPGLPGGWRLSPNGHLATRLPVVAELPPLEPHWQPGRYYSAVMERLRLRAPSGREFVVTSVHLPTIRFGIEEFLARKDTTELRKHTAWWGREMARILSTLARSSDVPVLIAGDFN
ncbi:MAG: endonuclease/exonuclease/phosphatase family protein, partial [Planctomycetia bacterium]|nr:endonuclease/exonuclease/phosphatase family protein [Planctomycetia bacterium]